MGGEGPLWCSAPFSPADLGDRVEGLIVREGHNSVLQRQACTIPLVTREGGELPISVGTLARPNVSVQFSIQLELFLHGLFKVYPLQATSPTLTLGRWREHVLFKRHRDLVGEPGEKVARWELCVGE